ncbi:MAG TPA: hypothetical protein VLK84_31315 [Longimicrobium sp.]|nr:hypothetical protein [Longimicrobium sp.]
MRISRFVLAATLTLVAACGRDAATPLAAPDEASASSWTRSYWISGLTYTGSHLNWSLASFAGGYVKVELVPDYSSMGAPYELGTVPADGDAMSFYKPANNSLRLTAIPTVAGCTFHGWKFNLSSTSIATQANPISMDSYRTYSQARAEFRCS